MLAPEVVDLVALVRATASLSRAVCVEGMTTLAAEVDLQALRQALANLLANARKFSPPGAPVMIRVDKEDERFACLRIRDFGPGVPPELLPSRPGACFCIELPLRPGRGAASAARLGAKVAVYGPPAPRVAAARRLHEHALARRPHVDARAAAQCDPRLRR